MVSRGQEKGGKKRNPKYLALAENSDNRDPVYDNDPENLPQLRGVGARRWFRRWLLLLDGRQQILVKEGLALLDAVALISRRTDSSAELRHLAELDVAELLEGGFGGGVGFGVHALFCCQFFFLTLFQVSEETQVNSPTKSSPS